MPEVSTGRAIVGEICVKARKAEPFISVILAFLTLKKASFSEDQEVSLRIRFSLRMKEFWEGQETGEGGGEERGGVTVMKQVRKLIKTLES